MISVCLLAATAFAGSTLVGRAQPAIAGLDSPFALEMKGKFDKAGKIDPAATVFTLAEGNKQILEALKQSITAIGDAGYFSYIAQLGPINDEFSIRTMFDGLSIRGTIRFDAANENRARSTVSGLKMMIEAAKLKISEQNDTLLLKSVNAVSDGKAVAVSFILPKHAFREMLERKLAVEKVSADR